MTSPTPDPVAVMARSMAKRRLLKDGPYGSLIDALTAGVPAEKIDADFDKLWSGTTPLDERQRQSYRADAIEAIAALEAAGAKIVWREPTREMWAAAGNAQMGKNLGMHHDAVTTLVWTALFDASPTYGTGEGR